MASIHNGYKIGWIGSKSDQFAIVAIDVKVIGIISTNWVE